MQEIVTIKWVNSIEIVIQVWLLVIFQQNGVIKFAILQAQSIYRNTTEIKHPYRQSINFVFHAM